MVGMDKFNQNIYVNNLRVYNHYNENFSKLHLNKTNETALRSSKISFLYRTQTSHQLSPKTSLFCIPSSSRNKYTHNMLAATQDSLVKKALMTHSDKAPRKKRNIVIGVCNGKPAPRGKEFARLSLSLSMMMVVDRYNTHTHTHTRALLYEAFARELYIDCGNARAASAGIRSGYVCIGEESDAYAFHRG